jgi:hypothetical protein
VIYAKNAPIQLPHRSRSTRATRGDCSGDKGLQAAVWASPAHGKNVLAEA